MMRDIVCYRSALFGGLFTSCTTSGSVSTFVVLPDTQTYLEQCPGGVRFVGGFWLPTVRK